MICNPLLPSATGCNQVTDPQTYTSGVIQTIVSIFMLVGVIYFIWHFVFAGYHLIASNGDPKKFESAKDEAVWAVLGLMVVFSVYALLKFVGFIVGVPSLETLQLPFPTL